MSSARPDEEVIFKAARRLPPGEPRDAYLAEACGGDEALRRRVQELLRVDEEERSFLAAPAVGPAGTAERPAAGEGPGVTIGAYKLIEPIGEGGMGTVWMAQQTEPVKRLVAIKLIKAGMDSRQVIARFEAERQALALMDHPNIARVLDGGTSDAGRPYFVMDLVKGVPITRYCDEHRLTPRQRLEIFIPVCQAIQHAHQKGIVHRDIKPNNVLVAPYDGKPVVKVIDFGVAKAAGQQLTERTLVTGYGAIVGTLEYMSPEQAELNNQDIDTRSDIYALGVLLYELLAGTPPFSRTELEKAGMLEMLRVIREQEPSRPSTKLSTAEGLPTLAANRGTEPAKLTKLVKGELDWIVMKALEKDRNRRYETANGFAMDVQRYLADEPVQACPPSAGYRMRKFARRNKGKLAVAALALFFLVLLGSGVGWVVRDRSARDEEVARQQRERHAKMAAQVELILTEVERLQAQQKWPEALEAVRRANAAVAGGEADPAIVRRVSELLKDLEFIDLLEQIRTKMSAWVDGKFDYGGADQEYGRAFHDYGVDVEELAEQTSIDRLKARPAFAIPLAAALDNWVDARREVSKENAAGWKRLVAIARGIDPDPLRDRLRSAWGQPVSSELQTELRRLAQSIDIRAQLPATLITLARTLQRVNDPDNCVRLLRDAQLVYPGDFWFNFNLGTMLYHRKDQDGAIRYLTSAVSIRPNSAAAHNNLGIALIQHGKLDEAIAVLHKAIELDPKYHIAPTNLGNALRDQKKLPEAIAEYRKVIELNPKYALAHNNLGAALHDQKKLSEAVAEYRKAIELNPKYAISHYNLGNLLREQKKLSEAVAEYHKAIELDPKDANAHNNLGLALHEQKNLDEAVIAYRKAIEIDPKNPVPHYGLGKVLYAQKKLSEAVAEYRKAIEFDPKYANAHNKLGDALHEQKNLDEATIAYRKAIEIDPKNPVPHYNLGNVLRDQKKLPEAIAEHRRAIELDPKSAHAHNNLGLALHDQKNLDEAAIAYRKVIEFDPNDSIPHYNLGNVLLDQKKLPEAIAEYRKAIELDPKYVHAHHNLGSALYEQKDLNGAIAAYRKTIELDPKDVDTYVYLGFALVAQKKLDDAIAAYLKAIELDPKNSVAYSSLGLALSDQKKLDEAIIAYRKAIELDPKFVQAHNNLGAALAEQKDFKGAAAAYRKAVELDPKYTRAQRALSEVLMILGKLAEARAVWEKFLESDPPDHESWYGYAELCLFMGNENAYRVNRKALLNRFGRTTDPVVAERTARACLLLPASGEELEKAVALADRAVTLGKSHEFYPFFMTAKALAEYRLDRFESALDWGKKAGAKGAGAPTYLVLAMANHRLGNAEQARNSLTTALATYDWKSSDGIIHALRREAQDLLGVAFDPENASANYGFGNVLKANGNLEKALAAYRAAATILEKKNPADALDFYNAACYRALTGAAQAQAKGPDADRLAKEEADRAMSMLTKAVAAGFADLGQLKEDTDLNLLRDREDFRKLLANFLPVARAHDHIRRSQWREAATDFGHLKQLAGPNSDLRFEHACLRLLVGDAADHASACSALLERGEQKNDLRPYLVARACTLAPLAAADVKRAARIAAGELKNPTGHWSLTEAAALKVRAGQYADAEVLLRRCLRENPHWDGIVLAQLWLALTLHGQGKLDEARKELAPALMQLDRWGNQMPTQANSGRIGLHIHDWLEAQILRREAESLLKTQ
jgi:tetratricopeptide (TPR) repeat protein/serine/threonine protein kinase